MDPWRNLPNEIFEKVLKDIEAEDLKTVGSVSREWRNFVDTDWALWKHHCCRALNRDILDKEILQELSWKDIFKQNYRKNGVLKRWKEGRYSTPECFKEQPDDFICELSVDTWGYILDMVCSV